MLRAVRFWTTGAASPFFALLLGTLAFEGCSLKSASQDAHLSLSLPNPHRVALAQSSLSGGGGSGLAPSAWNAPEFVCYGVNVTGPGIADTSSKPDVNPDLAGLIAGTTSCAYRGIVSKGLTFPTGGGEVSIDLQVPPGPDRVIQLVGITNADYCASNFLEKGGSTAPGAYEIGRVRADLFADTTVSIPITYVSSQSKRVDCGGSAATISAVATALGWAETSPRAAASANAAWTVAASGTGVSQEFQLYSGSSCATAVGAPATLSASTASQYVSGLADGVYSYTVKTVDGNGTATTSPCSSPMTLDTTAPGPASALAWGTASPTHTLALTASWTKSTSPDLAHQSVQFYSDSTCTAASGSPIMVNPPTSTATYTAPGDGSYTYKVTSSDLAGNSTASGCSAVMAVDTIVPTVAITSPAAGSYISSATVAAFNVSGTCSENGQNVAISGAATATVSCTAGAWSANLDLSAAAQGPVTINASQTDLAGNVSNPANRSFVKDTVAPMVSSVAISSGTFQYNSAATIAWIATDVNFGATPIRLEISTDNRATWTTITIVANSGSYGFALPTVGGTNTAFVRVTATDAAGNGSAPVESTVFTIIGVPAQIGFGGTPNLAPPQFGCEPYLFQLKDSLGANTVAQTNTTVSPTLSGAGFYTDAVCSTPLPGGMVTISTGAPGAQFYVSAGVYGAQTFSMTSTPGLTPLALNLNVVRHLYWDADGGSPSTFGLAHSRYGHTMISTGANAIVWGGTDQYLGPTSVQSSGSVYNFTTGMWTAMSTTAAPSARTGHTAVWTGSEMIVWGGKGASSVGSIGTSGGRYNPSTDTWSATSTLGAPSARVSHVTVWTGSKMLVFGGCDDISTCYNDLMVYDPGQDAWSSAGATGTPPSVRGKMAYAWVPGIGTASAGRLLVWGGTDATSSTVYANGAIYDVGSNAWIAMPAAPMAGAYSVSSTVAGTGASARWFLFGGLDASGNPAGVTALFDPSTNTWVSGFAPVGSGPSARSGAVVLSAGPSRIFVCGGTLLGGTLASDGAVLDLAANRWVTPMMGVAPASRDSATAVWDSSHGAMLLWGGYGISGDDLIHRFAN